MRVETFAVPVWALTRKRALNKGVQKASPRFRKVINSLVKQGLPIDKAEVAPIRVDRVLFKFLVHYEITASFKEYKKEPNCVVKKAKKLKKKATKKVYKK